MFKSFKRVFRIGQSKAKEKLEKVEDPIKLAEQSIRDLKRDLAESMKSLAEMKALAIRTKREVDQAHHAGKKYEQRAMAFLQKADEGQITTEEADRFALKALEQKDQIMQVSLANEKNLRSYETMIRKLELDVQKIRTQINTWEGELKTLKVRSRLSATNRMLNERVSSTNKNSLQNMIDDMKIKVEEQEALAKSYEELDAPDDTDQEVEKILGSDHSILSDNPSPRQKLQEMKERIKSLPPAEKKEMKEQYTPKRFRIRPNNNKEE